MLFLCPCDEAKIALTFHVADIYIRPSDGGAEPNPERLPRFRRYQRLYRLSDGGRTAARGADPSGVVDLRRGNISSYALFSRPAADGLSVGNFATLVPYGESFEHFGRVDAQVHDLRQAWERNWQQREATVVEPEGAAGNWQVRVPLSMPQAWDYITLPKLKKDWMQMLDVTREDDLGGRFGVGTAIHCAHKTADFRSRFIDWRPFQYFSCLERDPFSPLNFYSTWSLTPDGDGTIVGYAMAQPFLPEDAEQRDMSEETENLLNIMSAVMPAIFENLRRMVETKGAA